MRVFNASNNGATNWPDCVRCICSGLGYDDIAHAARWLWHRPILAKSLRAAGLEAVRWLRGSFKFTVATTLLVLAVLFAWAVLGPHDAATSGLLMVLSVYLLGQIMIDMVNAKLHLEERYIGLAMWQLLPHLLRLLLVAMLAFMMVELMTLHSVAYAYALISVGVFAIGTFLMWRMYCGHLTLQGHGDASVIASQLTQPASMGQVAAQSWPFGLSGVFTSFTFRATSS